MSINDEFYSHFPSLNKNSKENQRNKRISSEYSDYMKTMKQVSPKYTKQQQRLRRSRENAREEESPQPPPSSDSSINSMDVIFSGEDRNRFENMQKEQRMKVYQKSLQLQIEEQQLKKKKEKERQKQEELILEQRLQKQIDNIKKARDPQAEKIVERISLSENEKEVYNISKIALHNISNISNVSNVSSLASKISDVSDNSSSNNDVYRYFTQSAKLDTDLFNYKKYFSDILLDHVNAKHEQVLSKAAPKATAVALKLKEPKDRIKPKTKKPEIDTCSCSSSHTECSRCHKKLEMFCKECNHQHEKPLPEAANRRQIEDNEPELPFSKNQQVVVYRPSEEIVPYSFNVDPNSMFYRDTMKDLRSMSEMKLANYVKLYGDLRKSKMEDVHIRQALEQVNRTGVVPKRRPAIVAAPAKSLNLTPSKMSSDLEEILNGSEYTVLTQVGFARKQLEMEKLKL